MLLTQYQVSRLGRLIQLALFLLLVFSFFIDTIFLAAHFSPPASPYLEPFGSTYNKTFFIASIHHNTSPLRVTAWRDSILRLVNFLGPSNVYVSAVDRGSEDGTGFELLMLKTFLNERGVSNTFHLGMLPWYLSDGPYERDDFVKAKNMTVVEARNKALEPLKILAETGTTFDIVLWIDEDVAFRPQDITNLLETNNGHFAAACSLPTRNSPNILALRDDQGHRPATPSWPWFYSPKCRSAVLNWNPVPVASCWGGIVAFDAAPFYSEPSLQFRTTDASLKERGFVADERCLLHVDNLFGAEEGIWINPEV